MKEIIFKGSAGRIEGKYHHNASATAPTVLILHGNPKEQDMDNPVINTVFDAFVENGFSVLKFNFRGVGKSQGNSGDGEGELADATIALDWLHEKNIESKNYWICGFDFGALIALQLVMRRPEVENYVLLSPNMKKDDLNFIVPCIASGLVVRGGNDEVATEDFIIDLQDRLITKTESKVENAVIYNSDSSFNDSLEQLGQILDEYIKKTFSDNMSDARNIKKDKRRRRKKKIQDPDEERIVYINPIKPLDLDNL